MDYTNEALLAAERGIKTWAKEEMFKRREEITMIAAIIAITPKDVETDDVSAWPIPEKGRINLLATQQQIRDIRQAEALAVEAVRGLRRNIRRNS